jgi:sugar phosphate isomerase/epimerase
MIRLAAFGDEIAPDLEEQLSVLAGEGIRYLDLRGAWETNVLDLSDQQVGKIKEALAARDMAVAAIGSPIGKVPIDSPFGEHLHRFERALTLARAFQTPYVRIFSFYPPASAAGGDAADPAAYRDEVVARLREMVARARAADVILLHENEKGIYGDSITRCVDLLQSCDDAHFQAVLDPANFIQCGQTPYPDAYDALRPWLRYVHVKDARPDGSVVAAGEGAARWPELLGQLRADGYEGFLALEPHLMAAGQLSGFSGPERFRHAAQALLQLLAQMGWEYT